MDKHITAERTGATTFRITIEDKGLSGEYRTRTFEFRSELIKFRDYKKEENQMWVAAMDFYRLDIDKIVR